MGARAGYRRVGVFARKYTTDTRPFVPFHVDSNTWTGIIYIRYYMRFIAQVLVPRVKAALASAWDPCSARSTARAAAVLQARRPARAWFVCLCRILHKPCPYLFSARSTARAAAVLQARRPAPAPDDSTDTTAAAVSESLRRNRFRTHNRFRPHQNPARV